MEHSKRKPKPRSLLVLLPTGEQFWIQPKEEGQPVNPLETKFIVDRGQNV